MTTSLQQSASARKVSSFAAPRLADVCSGRNNNLNLLRVLAAVGVLYAHAYGIPELAKDDPIERALGLSLGDLGVDVFFFVSGLLITKSFANKTLTEFAWARFVRIFPALWVSSLAFVVVAGLFFSPLSAREFWSRPETLTYLLRNSTMLPGLGAQQALPFALDTHVAEFNQPLWTLPHELQMYMLLGVLGALGGLRSVWPVTGVLSIGLAGVAANKLFGVEPIAGVTPIKSMLDELNRPIPKAIVPLPGRSPLPSAEDEGKVKRDKHARVFRGAPETYDLQGHATQLASRAASGSTTCTS